MELIKREKKLIVDMRNGNKKDMLDLAKLILRMSNQLSRQNSQLYIKPAKISLN